MLKHRTSAFAKAMSDKPGPTASAMRLKPRAAPGVRAVYRRFSDEIEKIVIDRTRNRKNRPHHGLLRFLFNFHPFSDFLLLPA
jgi:hypothetical protein